MIAAIPEKGTMETVYKNIYEKAKPYLDVRDNDVHVLGAYDLCVRLLAHYPEANPDVVLPAILLHDVGWKFVPEEVWLNAFGPTANDPETLRIHEAEGVRIAKEILESINYGEKEVEEILTIIDGHDSRRDALSLNDALVKDADKLFRYTPAGLDIACRLFCRTMEALFPDLETKMSDWFLTPAARDIAREALEALRPSIRGKTERQHMKNE